MGNGPAESSSGYSRQSGDPPNDHLHFFLIQGLFPHDDPGPLFGFAGIPAVQQFRPLFSRSLFNLYFGALFVHRNDFSHIDVAHVLNSFILENLKTGWDTAGPAGRSVHRWI